jgi:hypothetical protein
MTQFILLKVWKNCMSFLGKFIFKRSRLDSKRGYGLALLMVFLASSVLLATSMSLILSSSVVSYITGQSSSTPIVGSQTQIANAALDAAKNDILTNYLANGTTVDTTYRYPVSGSNSITAPTYPGSGATTTIGSYYVTVTKARGFTYILQATVTVNGMTRVVSRLYQLSGSKCVYKDPFYFAYSLRQLCPSYTGKAVKVRRSSDNATQDIGFVGANFDVAALRAFLGEDLPLNVDSSSKAAYSLRKLSTSYSGYAIKVRCSTCTPTTQNIGFNSFGNLDVKALLAYVGTGSGYIDTWYDQSGQNLNLTQSTTTKQPRIVNAGVVDMKNGIPAVYFGGGQSMSSAAATGISGAELRSFLVADIESGTNLDGYFACLFKSGDSDPFSTASSAVLLAMNGTSTKAYAQFNGSAGSLNPITITTANLFQATTYHDAATNVRTYNSGVMSTPVTRTSNLSPTNIIIGVGAGSDSGTYMTGYISELVLYSSAVTGPNQTKIEKNQDHYYQIANYTDGFVTTWYDQSGNGFNVTQSTAANQPGIDVSGSQAAVLFDKTKTTYLKNATLSSTLSPALLTAFFVGQIYGRNPNDNDHYSGNLLGLQHTGDGSFDRDATSEMIWKQNGHSLENMKDSDQLDIVANNLVFSADIQSTVITNGTNRTLRVYQTSTGANTNTTTNKASQSVIINTVQLGVATDTTSYPWDGRINEILFFTTALPNSNYQNYETDQRTYYGL